MNQRLSSTPSAPERVRRVLDKKFLCTQPRAEWLGVCHASVLSGRGEGKEMGQALVVSATPTTV